MTYTAMGISEKFSSFGYGLPTLGHAIPFPQLHDFSFIRTFRLYFRDANLIKKVITYVLLFIFLFITPAAIIPSYKLVLCIGFFCSLMICRYMYVLHRLKSTHISITRNELCLPIFNVTTTSYETIAWKNVTTIEIIGDAQVLSNIMHLQKHKKFIFESLTENIVFIRGIIFHYQKDKKQEICAITDNMLDTLTLWKLYTYSSLYKGQQKLHVRLALGEFPLYLYPPNTENKTLITLAKKLFNNA